MATRQTRSEPTKHAAEIDINRTTEFLFKGNTYKVAPSDMWPYRVLPLLSAGNVDEVLKILLGAEQYDQLLADENLTIGDANRIFEVMQAATNTGKSPSSRKR